MMMIGIWFCIPVYFCMMFYDEYKFVRYFAYPKLMSGSIGNSEHVVVFLLVCIFQCGYFSNICCTC